jgi:cyanophycinase
VPDDRPPRPRAGPRARDGEPGDVVCHTRSNPDDKALHLADRAPALTPAGGRAAGAGAAAGTAASEGDGARRTARGDGAATRPEPEHRRHLDTGLGTLVLIGGAASATGAAVGRFLDLTDARRGGHIVGLTTASQNPVGSAQAWRNDFALAGAKNIEIPIVDRRDRAQSREIAAMVRDARGIFLGGGDQIQLIATISGTRVGDAIREAHAAGTVVCGTSAGAAALTETTLANGELNEKGELVEMYIGPGLGLLGFHTMIDTHFAERRRLHRLFVAIAGYPEIMGLGIDEDTALVVNGHVGEVVGRGSVTFVDGRGVRYDNADQVKRLGAKLTLSSLRVGIVGEGHVFNLRDRELEALVQAREADDEFPVVKGEEAR